MTRARELARLGNENVLSVEDDSLEVGINSTKPTSALDVAGQFNVGTAIKAGVAGVITATEFSGTTGTFSGNVSVGGTLTYEDVTNIDSLGIITARSGINVSAGTLTAAEGINVSAGIVTIADGATVNSTLTATEGLNVTAGVGTFAGNLTVAGTSTFAKKTTVNATLEATEGLNVTAGVTTIAGTTTFGADITIPDKIIHSGDTNTNIRFPAADTFTVETGGSERLRIASGGKIGIGINDPERLLHLSSNNTVLALTDTAAATDEKTKYILSDAGIFAVGKLSDDYNTATENLRIDNNGNVKITGAGSTTLVSLYADQNTAYNGSATDGQLTSGVTLFMENDANANNTINQIVMQARTGYEYNRIVTTGGSGPEMAICVNNAERIRIDSSGNVGLGTDNPAQDFHIQAGSGTMRIESTSDATSSRIEILGKDNSYAGLHMGDTADVDAGGFRYYNTDNYLQIRTNGGERVRINQYGMMGLSVTSPDALLSVLAQNSNTPPLVIQNPDNDENFSLATYHDSNGIYATIGANYKLNSGGSAVVDTTDHRTAGILFDARNNGSIAFETNAAGSQPDERARIDQNGQVLIGTDTNRGLNGHDPKLQITGTTYSHSTVSITNNANDATGSYLFFVKQRSGSVGGSTVVADNDIIGECRFNAGDGTDVDSLAARIICHVDGTPGSNDTPGRLTFLTTKDGDNSCTERLLINNKGRIGLSHDTPLARLHTGQDTNDTVAAFIIEGPNDKSAKMYHKYVHNGSTAAADTCSLLTINSFQSSNSHIFGKVNVMGVSPTADFGFEAEGMFYAERGADNTTITNAQYGSMTLVGDSRGTGGNTQGSIAFDGLTLKYTTSAVAYLTMRINVEYIVYDGATVTFHTDQENLN